jgi:hypothetical protein
VGSQSGTIREDPARVLRRRWNDSMCGPEVGRTSPDGERSHPNSHPGIAQEDAAGKQPAHRKVVFFIHQILAADQQAPRKQRHTAQRIYQRLREEMRCGGCDAVPRTRSRVHWSHQRCVREGRLNNLALIVAVASFTRYSNKAITLLLPDDQQQVRTRESPGRELLAIM